MPFYQTRMRDSVCTVETFLEDWESDGFFRCLLSPCSLVPLFFSLSPTPGLLIITPFFKEESEWAQFSELSQAFLIGSNYPESLLYAKWNTSAWISKDEVISSARNRDSGYSWTAVERVKYNFCKDSTERMVFSFKTCLSLKHQCRHMSR